MSREKLRIANTDLDNLIGNLRGEVGEIITGFSAMRRLMSSRQQLSEKLGEAGEEGRDLIFLGLLKEKLSDELVGRLSEISEQKVGRLTFYFAARKIGDRLLAFHRYPLQSLDSLQIGGSPSEDLAEQVSTQAPDRKD